MLLIYKQIRDPVSELTKRDMARCHFDPRSLSIDHISETDRFGDMLGADLVGTREVSDRPCNFNDAVLASGRKMQLFEDDM